MNSSDINESGYFLMNECKNGMLAKAKAGHDTGKVYVIIDSDSEYVYLADGRIRTIQKLKKKKKKHVQLIKYEQDVLSADDAQIRRILREYTLSGTIKEYN